MQIDGAVAYRAYKYMLHTSMSAGISNAIHSGVGRILMWCSAPLLQHAVTSSPLFLSSMQFNLKCCVTQSMCRLAEHGEYSICLRFQMNSVLSAVSGTSEHDKLSKPWRPAKMCFLWRLLTATYSSQLMTSLSSFGMPTRTKC